jgi:mRNA-degrading endonuclease RelE of RelBE toxin-antitoxin system
LCSALSLIISDLKHIPKEAKDLFQNTSKELNNKLIPQIMKKLEEMSNN